MTIKKYLVLMLLQNNQALHKKETDTNIDSHYPSGSRDWRSSPMIIKKGWHCLRNKLTFCNMHTFPSIMTDGGGVEIAQRHVNYFDILQERVKAWNNIVCRKKMKHIYNNLKRLCQAFLEFIHSTSWDLIELFRKRFVTIWVWKLTVPIFPRQDNRGLFDFDKLKWTVRAQLNDSQIIHLM